MKRQALKTEWLNRTLISGPYLCLALSEDAYHSAMTDMGIPMSERGPWILNSHSNATQHTIENKDGRLCAIVCIRDCEARSGIEVAGLLVHEAVHVWQRFCESIGETATSLEFEAYSIQAISQQLMWSYQDQTA